MFTYVKQTGIEMARGRKLTAYENKLVNAYNLQASAISGRTKYFDVSDLVAAHNQEVAKKIAAEAVTRQSDSEYFTSVEFRQEVIDELMENGATLEQATNRTRDQYRLFNEARELGLM